MARDQSNPERGERAGDAQLEEHLLQDDAKVAVPNGDSLVCGPKKRMPLTQMPLLGSVLRVLVEDMHLHVRAKLVEEHAAKERRANQEHREKGSPISGGPFPGLVI